jgi:PncC family amidohydrolase
MSALAAEVLELLRTRGLTLALAESCTGGLLAAELTAIAGSSDVVQGSVVSYSNAVKTSLLGVSEDGLHWHGAVSEVVAREMAAGAAARLHADVGVGITGIAGPGGGSADKPVGLVYIAWCVSGNASCERLVFDGDRDAVRRQSVKAALEGLKLQLA